MWRKGVCFIANFWIKYLATPFSTSSRCACRYFTLNDECNHPCRLVCLKVCKSARCQYVALLQNHWGASWCPIGFFNWSPTRKPCTSSLCHIEAGVYHHPPCQTAPVLCRGLVRHISILCWCSVARYILFAQVKNRSHSPSSMPADNARLRATCYKSYVYLSNKYALLKEKTLYPKKIVFQVLPSEPFWWFEVTFSGIKWPPVGWSINHLEVAGMSTLGPQQPMEKWRF